jgi:translocation and assembly module TamB
MRKKLVYSLLAVFMVLLLGFTGFFAWLLGTPAGARWVFSEISLRTTIKVEAEKIKGRLWTDLDLEGVRIYWPDGNLSAERSHLRWRPLMILSTTVSVKELHLQNVRIQDNRPEEPTDLKWPRVSGLPSYIAAKISDLKISGLTYRRLEQAPVIINDFSSKILWRRGVLYVRDLSVNASTVSGQGSIRAGFRRPSLDLGLSLYMSKPLEQMDHVKLSAHFLPAGAPVQLGGPIEVVGMKGVEPRMKFSVDAGIERKAVIFEKLHLTRAGRRGVVGGKGEIRFAPAQTELQLALGVDSLDLYPQLPAETDLSGEIRINGTFSDYKGDFSFTNKGEKWRSAAMSGSFKGKKKGVYLDIVKSSVLGGSLTGAVEADWDKGISITGKLRGRSLNPEVIQPGWKGIINLDLDGKADMSAKYPEGNMHIKLLESQLHGKTLSGAVDADFAAGDVIISRLFLRGKGFDLRAKGDLQKRLDFGVDVADLSALVPDSAGSLKADGWVRWREDLFSVALKGRGKHLIFNGAKIASLDLAGELSDQKGSPVNISADIRKLEYKDMLVNEVTAKVSGTTLHNEIAVDARAGKTPALQTKLTGSYEQGVWTGKIDRASVHDAAGPFNLVSPADVSVSRGRILLGPLVMKGASSEQFRLAADISRNPLNGFFKAAWGKINLAHLNPWMKNTELSGNSSGKGAAEWQAGKLTRVSSSFSASGTFTSGQERVDVKTAEIGFDWGASGLQTSVRLQLSEGGMLSGRISSPVPVHTGFPEAGRIDADWRNLNLSMISLWLKGSMVISGDSSGNLHALWQNKDIENINSNIEASGAFTVNRRRTAVKSSSTKVVWNEQGLNASVDLELKEGGKLHGFFSSAAKPHLAVPQKGRITVDWRGFNLAFLQPWLSDNLSLKGTLSGRANGRLLADKEINMSGDISIAGGSITHRARGTLSANLQTAEVKWAWQGKNLQADISLVLEKYGSLKGHMILPLPARIPVSINHSGKVEASLSGKAQENGLLTSLFPGLVRESRGDLELSANVGGTWDNPLPEGTIQVMNAGAYFPAVGIKISNVLFKSHLDGKLITVDTLQAESGSGKIQGGATLHLKQWHITGYEGYVKGKNFRCIYLPEYRATVSPDLTIKGDAEKVSIGGEMKVPEFAISGPQAPSVIEPSKDVIIVDRKSESGRKSPMSVDINVHVILGDHAVVKAEGVDARLKGDIFVTAQNLNDIRGRGTINIVQGTYKRYSIDLKITRGRVLFFGGPIENPRLDVLALRTVQDVRAGVLVSGTLESPVIKLYSNPSMPDADILSYIVTGHAGAGQSKEDAPLMAQAANVLLSKSQSVVLQDQLKKRLGIDVLDVETSKTTSAKTGETTSRSLVTIGKYLTPKLYISYGQALMGSGNLVKLRYDVSKHFQLESESGTASGADLIYNINFK